MSKIFSTFVPNFNGIEIDAFNYGEFDIFRNIADGKAKGNYC